MKKFIDFMKMSKLNCNMNEAVQTLGSAQNNDAILANNFNELMQNIRDKAHTLIKVIYANDHQIKVANVRSEFQFDGRENANIRIEYNFTNDAETYIESLFNDYQQIINHSNNNGYSINDSVLKVYNSVHGNTNNDFYAYYDNETNVVFIIINNSNFSCERYLNSVKSILSNNNCITNGKIDFSHQALIQLLEQEVINESQTAIALISPFVSNTVINEIISQQIRDMVSQIDITDQHFYTFRNNNVNDTISSEIHNNQNIQQNQPVDNTQQNEPDNNQNDQNNNQNDQNNEEPEQDNDEVNDEYQTINNLRIIEKNINDINYQRENILMSKRTFNDFTNEINSYNAAGIRTFNEKPVIFKQIQWNPEHSLLKRLTFFIVEKTNNVINIIFPMFKNKHLMIFKKTNVNEHLINAMLSQPAASWERTLNTVIWNSYVRFQLELLYDPDNIGYTLRNANVPAAQRQALANQPGNKLIQNNGDAAPQQRRQRRVNQNAGNNNELTDEQIAQLEHNIEQSMANTDDVTDVDIELFLTNKPKSCGRSLSRTLERGHKYFLIKFPGVDIPSKTGTEAEQFLNQVSLWSGTALKREFDNIKQQYQDIVLAVTFDGKYLTAAERHG